MNSSISRCASSRSGTTTRSTVPSGFSRILRSGMSRSSGSRSSRARFTHGIGVVERLQDRIEQGAGDVVGPAVDRGLRLRVIEFRGRAHQDAVKAVRALAAVIADHHPHGQRAARLARHQRAQIVGDALGQHRHHAIREIHRVAARQRVAVERRTRPHIEGDVGDRDMDDVAALVVRIGIGLGMDRVVMVLGVGRIDGDERQVAPVLAALQRGGLCLLGLAQRGGREGLRNFVGVDRDQADGLFRSPASPAAP